VEGEPAAPAQTLHGCRCLPLLLLLLLLLGQLQCLAATYLGG
jgi:hypothetical protein